jgi:MoxR-like ATPase
MSTASEAESAARAEFEATAEALDRLKAQMGSVIFGQERVIEEALVTVLAGGHGLLVGVPGLAKTLLVESLARVLGLETRRIQFTPDLMPKDIIGSEVLEEGETGRRSFRFIEGPVFCQLLMADEINRASPRTQSALLQAMQEQEVSVSGERKPLPRPFHVLATQNPLEQEGTYPLPEAQLDRFLLQIDVGYPDAGAERAMLLATTGVDTRDLSPQFDGISLMAAQRLVRSMPVGERVLEAILDLVRGARPDTAAHDAVTEFVVWGPGPRASQALMLAVRARALLGGRFAPSLDDVKALAGPILRHRMALSYAARGEGWTVNRLIETLAESIR